MFCLKVIEASFDEEDHAFVLTVSIAKVGQRKPKPKALPPPAPVAAPVTETKPPPKSPPKSPGAKNKWVYQMKQR